DALECVHLERRSSSLSPQREADAIGHAMIYFEDLKVGAETDFGTYDVTREEVLEFATQHDPQPFHLSDEAAAKTQFWRPLHLPEEAAARRHFGRIAASGWHTAAMTMAVIARHVVKHEQAGLGS